MALGYAPILAGLLVPALVLVPIADSLPRFLAVGIFGVGTVGTMFVVGVLRIRWLRSKWTRLPEADDRFDAPDGWLSPPELVALSPPDVVGDVEGRRVTLSHSGEMQLSMVSTTTAEAPFDPSGREFRLHFEAERADPGGETSPTHANTPGQSTVRTTTDPSRSPDELNARYRGTDDEKLVTAIADRVRPIATEAQWFETLDVTVGYGDSGVVTVETSGMVVDSDWQRSHAELAARVAGEVEAAIDAQR